MKKLIGIVPKNYDVNKREEPLSYKVFEQLEGESLQGLRVRMNTWARKEMKRLGLKNKDVMWALSDVEEPVKKSREMDGTGINEYQPFGPSTKSQSYYLNKKSL